MLTSRLPRGLVGPSVEPTNDSCSTNPISRTASNSGRDCGRCPSVPPRTPTPRLPSPCGATVTRTSQRMGYRRGHATLATLSTPCPRGNPALSPGLSLCRPTAQPAPDDTPSPIPPQEASSGRAQAYLAPCVLPVAYRQSSLLGLLALLLSLPHVSTCLVCWPPTVP